VVALGTAATFVRADAVGYDRVVDLEAKGDTFFVRHHHDWTGRTSGARAKMMTTTQDPFGADNDYAFVSWHSPSGAVLRKLPSPALTWLGVTADSRYVIGISGIKLTNPYQLVVYDRDGELLLKRHIGATVACLTPDQFQKLRGRLTPVLDRLENRIWRDGDRVYVDYGDSLSPREHSGIWNALRPHDCRSPFSPAITGSVTNAIHWFDARDPAPTVMEEGGVPVGVRIKDPKGVPFTIPFRLQMP
jgi:hypothetical protein